MDESKFNALIQLLDDDDPIVSAQVEKELLAAGDEIIARLETVWENMPESALQRRIESIIQLIQSKDTIGDLLAWRKSGGNDLLKAWYLISRYRYPNLDFQEYHDSINRLVNRIWLEMGRSMPIRERFAVITRMVFANEGFKSNHDDMYEPANYFLNTFFDRKIGSPLSLGILFFLICEKLEIPVFGTIQPSYFMLLYKDDREEFYIDVFNRGQFRDREEIEQFFHRMNIEPLSSYFRPTSKIYIVLEMINLLMYAYERDEDIEKLEEMRRLKEGIRIDANF